MRHSLSAVRGDRCYRSLHVEVQLFAGLEANGLAGSDGDLGAGARIAADAGFARLAR